MKELEDWSFARVPLGWINERSLLPFDLANGFDALKILFALAEQRALKEKSKLLSRDAKAFHASASALARGASIARRRVFGALRFLERQGVIRVVSKEQGKSSAYAFVGQGPQFHKLPYAHIANKGVLQAMRERTMTNLTALKLYLLLLYVRNRVSGVSLISYTRLEAYGLDRTLIRDAVGLLTLHGAIHAYGEAPAKGAKFTQPNSYVVRGLGPTPPLDRRGEPRLGYDTELTLASQRFGLRR